MKPPIKKPPIKIIPGDETWIDPRQARQEAGGAIHGWLFRITDPDVELEPKVMMLANRQRRRR